MERPDLSKKLSVTEFKQYYYLKEELVFFCRELGLQVSGSKEMLTERITHFLRTGEKLVSPSRRIRKNKQESEILPDSIIEEEFVCTEKHRAFYKKRIGSSFSFNVMFQKWLKQNAGKTYAESIIAYDEILEKKKTSKTNIDKQFEYNTYIRDFFEKNKDKSLKDAIICWKFKKQLPGHNRYEEDDLKSLK